MPARIGSPGTTTRLPCSRPSTPARAACSADGLACAGNGLLERLAADSPSRLTPRTRSSTGPGRERGDGHAGAAHLLVERLGEGQHVGLGGRVAGRVGQRLHPGGRGDVEDRAAAALDHPGRNAEVSATSASTSTRTCSSSRSGSARGTAPPVAKPALLTRISTSSPSDCDPAREPLRARPACQVAAERLGPHAVLALQLVGELVEPLLAPGDEDQRRGRAGPARGRSRRRSRPRRR